MEGWSSEKKDREQNAYQNKMKKVYYSFVSSL